MDSISMKNVSCLLEKFCLGMTVEEGVVHVDIEKI